jgi:uncharacterized membrane protein YdbT with pleckstrin-like domain
MGYVTENLLKGERVIERARIHWWAWGKGLAVIFLGFALAATDAAGLAGFLFLFGLVLVVRGVILVLTTELAVTDRRVIAKFGLIRRRTVELLHQKVEGLTVDQSIFGRLLGFGTVVVNGTGSGRTPVPHITKPLEFRKSALETVEARQQGVV